MALNDSVMVAAAGEIQALLTHARLHTAAAGGSGTANVAASAALAVTWDSPTGDGDFALADPLNFSGGTASGAVYSVTLWTGTPGSGTFRGEFVLTGDAAFNAAGEYVVTAIALAGSAT